MSIIITVSERGFIFYSDSFEKHGMFLSLLYSCLSLNTYKRHEITYRLLTQNDVKRNSIKIKEYNRKTLKPNTTAQQIITNYNSAMSKYFHFELFYLSNKENEREVWFYFLKFTT